MTKTFSLPRSKKSVYFFYLIKKVRPATDTIRREMRQRGRATGAELAAATGLSLVTIYKELARLESRGEVRKNPQSAPSRGGRCARIYECEPGYARRLLLSARRQGGILQMQLEISDLQGRSLRREQSSWARLEPGSVEAWLDSALSRRQRIAGIALDFDTAEEITELCERIRKRYHCPVVSICPAEALADGEENTVTLYLPRGATPRGSLRRRGSATPTGALELLPLPAAWETLDYTDHTLVEEMIARLLQAITCVMAPARINLHADFWSTRLTERIRYNTRAKLKASAPELGFIHTAPVDARAAIRHMANML